MVLLRCVGWSRDDILTFSDFGPNLLRTRKPNCVVGRQSPDGCDLYDARQIIALCLPGWGAETLAASRWNPNTEAKLQPPRYSRLNNGPVGQEHDKEHLSQRSLDRVRKANKPIRERSCPKFLSFSVLRPPSFAVQEEGGEGRVGERYPDCSGSLSFYIRTRWLML